MVVGSLSVEKEVVVIGGGPGGYISAIRAAQLGKEVLLVNNAGLGGICLNNGCIPLNALHHLVQTHKRFQNAKELGITFDNYSLDFNKWISFRNRKITRLRKGIEYLLKSHGVEYVNGKASFLNENELSVVSDEGRYTVEFENAVIAVGASPVPAGDSEFNGTSILSAYDLLSLDEIPESLTIIGTVDSAVAIGSLYSSLGSKVTVMYDGDRVFPFLDPDAEKMIIHGMKKEKIKIQPFSNLKKVQKLDNNIQIEYEYENTPFVNVSEKVIFGLKYKPNLDLLNISNAGIKLDTNGFIKTGPDMKTSVSNIYAAGDVSGGLFYANKAAMQAKVAADTICGKNSSSENVLIPRILYFIPEAAWVGVQANKDKLYGEELVSGKFPLSSLGKHVVSQSDTGLVKLVFEKNSGTIVGGLIIGENAGGLIAQLTMAIEMSAHKDGFSLTVPVQPTAPEAFLESADEIQDLSVHLGKKR